MNLERTRIAIPGTSNLRDLGGYLGADGLELARGRLLRSEVLAQPGASSVHAIWDAAHADHYEALALRTIVDLRSDDEVDAAPSAWRRATGADVVRLPIAGGGEGGGAGDMRRLLSGEFNRFDAADLTRLYIAMLERRAAVFGQAIRLLGDAGRLPVLVHCTAGKDRTGLLVALVLSVLGTPRELVVEDYALTGVLRPNRVTAYTDVLQEAGVDPDAVRVLFETPASAMQGALAHLDTVHGGAEGLLLSSGGLVADDLHALRRALLVRAP